MHHTRDHTSWRISRPTTIEPELQADMVPTGEVCAVISMRFTLPTSRKHAYFGTSSTKSHQVHHIDAIVCILASRA
jgi:hypothetical protein